MAQISGKVADMAAAQTKLNTAVTSFTDNLTNSLNSIRTKVEGSEWAGGVLTTSVDQMLNIVDKFKTDYAAVQDRSNTKLTNIQQYLQDMDTEFTSSATNNVGTMESTEGEAASLMPS